jgi:Asp-tRNA(Asn)/Glu-tRNA(Gln) amidotransferase C subunit
MTINISIGELLDRISILQIKSQHTDKVQQELNTLRTLAESYDAYNTFFLEHLHEVNSKLWNIEDELRVHEKSKDFSESFIEKARQVYILNDKRAEIKRQINDYYCSNQQEVKIYS